MTQPREIKFRVWNPQQNMMTNVSLCDYLGFHGIVYDRVGCNNEDNVWMQFTGLIDINGNEIYEGDIVHIEEEKGQVWTVEYDESTARFIVFNQLNSNRDFDFYFAEVGVVPIVEVTENFIFKPNVLGNIYEHPHLLTPTNQ